VKTTGNFASANPGRKTRDTERLIKIDINHQNWVWFYFTLWNNFFCFAETERQNCLRIILSKKVLCYLRVRKFNASKISDAWD
jgi:hypothetical protein